MPAPDRPDSNPVEDHDHTPPSRPADKTNDGKAPPDDVDAPRALLNRMRAASLSRGHRPQRTSGRLEGGNGSRTRRGAGQATAGEGSGSGRDPQKVGALFNRLVNERGWKSPVAVGSVIARWDELVGPDISARCRPESFTDTVVQVRADSTAWATQLRLLSPSLLARFDAVLGSGVVTRIQVLGPATPNWKKGRRSVRGRGPRDTYG